MSYAHNANTNPAAFLSQSQNKKASSPNPAGCYLHAILMGWGACAELVEVARWGPIFNSKVQRIYRREISIMKSFTQMDREAVNKSMWQN